MEEAHIREVVAGIVENTHTSGYDNLCELLKRIDESSLTYALNTALYMYTTEYFDVQCHGLVDYPMLLDQHEDVCGGCFYIFVLFHAPRIAEQNQRTHTLVMDAGFDLMESYKTIIRPQCNVSMSRYIADNVVRLKKNRMIG